MVEAVGVPVTFEVCTGMVRPGGHVGSIGVHGRPVALHLESLWARDVTVTVGARGHLEQARLIRLRQFGRLDLAPMITHTFSLGDMIEAYAAFERAAQTGPLEVVLTKAGS